MASLAPPPPPTMGGPPPPPPPMMGGGPPPPPNGMPPLPMPPMKMNMPPVGGNMNMGGGGPPRIPFTNTILLTDVPSFLHSFRAIRDWLYPCGSARNAVFYPRKSTTTTTDGDNNLPSDAKIHVLINMSHPDGALKFLGSFKQFAARLDERYSQIQAYMVPASPDLPLPPPFLDEETQQHLAEKLWQNFVSLESPELNSNVKDAKDNTMETEPTTQLLDVGKVAAAAGGGNYDADEDPLNAPQVLEAVKEFRRKLEKTQGFQKKKRMELVGKKVAERMPRVKVLMEEERIRGPVVHSMAAPPLPPPTGGVGGGPVPGLPPGMTTAMGAAPPPLPMGVLPPPPPPPGVAATAGAAQVDSGKRGRSNLPAWMTNQPPASASTEEEPSAKRSKLSNQQHPLTFPPLPPSTHAILRDFLTQQIIQYLGEEEKTLIDFLHTHILNGKDTAGLVKELQMVLEEETPAFVETLWTKIYELQQQQ